MYQKFVTQKIFDYVKRHAFFLFAIVFYLLTTFYYMGPSLTSCDTTLYGFGDNTAGPVWRATLPEDQGLIGARTATTNAPYGDNLENPIGYSLILQTILIRGAQAVAGPICGYNIVNILSFVVSALVMYGFIYALTRNRWVALFAGYAVAFSPYYQMKVGGHPSYGFQAIFIGLIWLFYRLLQYQRKRDALYLALMFMVSIYFDPYFTLFSGLIVASLGLTWLVINKKVFLRSLWQSNKASARTVTRQFKLLALSAGLMVAATLPLAGIYLINGQQINDNVAASRGNVLEEAKACSNWPHEYLVPFVLHPLFKKVFGEERYIQTIDYLKGGFSCGIGEDSVGLSLVLVFIVIIGTVIIFWERLNKRRQDLSRILTFNPTLLIAGLVVLGLVAFTFALPPVRFRGIVPTPSYELLSVTLTWRTLARLYMIVNIVLVILSAVLFVYLRAHFKQYRRILVVLFVLVCGIVFVEYQAFMPLSGNKLSTFNYAKDAPSAYTWLKKQKTIQTIAEYPLEQYGRESDVMSYYLSMQVVHRKKLFNSALSYGAQESLKDGLKNLADPQTVHALRSFGVDAVVIHGVTDQEVATNMDGKLIYSAPRAEFNMRGTTPTVKNDNMIVLDIRAVSPAEYYIDLGPGFVRNATIINSAADWKYEAISGSDMYIRKFNQKNVVDNTEPVSICFSAQMSVPLEKSTLNITTHEGKRPIGVISGELNRYKTAATSKIKIETANGHNMRVTRLGCENNE